MIRAGRPHCGGSLSDCLWNGTENTPGTSRTLHYSARVPRKKKKQRQRGEKWGEKEEEEEEEEERAGWKRGRVKGAQCHPSQRQPLPLPLLLLLRAHEHLSRDFSHRPPVQQLRLRFFSRFNVEEEGEDEGEIRSSGQQVGYASAVKN